MVLQSKCLSWGKAVSAKCYLKKGPFDSFWLTIHDEFPVGAGDTMMQLLLFPSKLHVWNRIFHSYLHKEHNTKVFAKRVDGGKSLGSTALP